MCLVTGGWGFAGSHLSERLLARGAKVTILDRVRPRNSYLAMSGLADRVDWVQGDIRDLDLLRLTLQRLEVDVVFHLAAQPLVGPGNVLPAETLSINSMGTYSVLEAVRTAKPDAALVFASSGAYYGATTAERAIVEDDPPLPANNLYAASKVAGDVAVRTYARTYGLKAACCRFMNTYGPGDTNFTRIVPKAIRHLLDGKPYDFGDRDDGRSVLDTLYIADMAEAYISVADRIEAAAGEAFNFGGGRPITTRELTAAVSVAFDGKLRDAHFGGPVKARRSIKFLDTTKAARVLGWRPATPLEDGLAKTIEWYRRHREAV